MQPKYPTVLLNQQGFPCDSGFSEECTANDLNVASTHIQVELKIEGTPGESSKLYAFFFFFLNISVNFPNTVKLIFLILLNWCFGVSESKICARIYNVQVYALDSGSHIFVQFALIEVDS